MRILVTGASGQLGWELSRSLKILGEILAIDRQDCDLAQLGDVARIIQENRPEVIVNAAAYTAVDKAESEEGLATLVNATSVGIMAETARKMGALLIHYSTDYVFDGTKDSPYTERDPPNPVNAYGRSKLAGEHAIVRAGSDYLIVRTCWVFAARGQNFLLTILRLARERGVLSIVADQIGAPTWARHIAQATATIVQAACLERNKTAFNSEILHLAASGTTSWFQFAEAIVDQAVLRGLLTNRPTINPISSAEYPLPAARPKNSRLVGQRLHKRFGITLPDWQQGLDLCLRDVALVRSS